MFVRIVNSEALIRLLVLTSSLIWGCTVCLGIFRVASVRLFKSIYHSIAVYGNFLK